MKIQMASIVSTIERRVLCNDHDLNTIFVLAIIAVVSLADTWNEIENFR